MYRLMMTCLWYRESGMNFNKPYPYNEAHPPYNEVQ